MLSSGSEVFDLVDCDFPAKSPDLSAPVVVLTDIIPSRLVKATGVFDPCNNRRLAACEQQKRSKGDIADHVIVVAGGDVRLLAVVFLSSARPPP